jgi:hypothetical protein
MPPEDGTTQPNPFFPLHKDLLTVALRELLLLDGSIDSLTCKLHRTKTAMYLHPHSGEIKELPRFQGHARGWQSGEVSKNHARESKSRGSRRLIAKRQRVMQKRGDTPESTETPALWRQHSVKVECSSAREVVDVLLARIDTPGGNGRLPKNCGKLAVPISHQDDSQRPLRKVSDLDLVKGATTTRILSDSMLAANDIAQFATLDGRFQLRGLASDLPELLQASTETESRLRQVAFSQCVELVVSFDDQSLCRMVGYEVSSIKRERAIDNLANHLFEVSHALFAWENTDSEICQTQLGLSSCQREELIKETLFDSRSMECLGGWESSSLLRQSLTVKSGGNTSWERWAQTRAGQDVIQHHQSSEATLRAGRLRRPVREPATQIGKTCGSDAFFTTSFSNTGQRWWFSSVTSLASPAVSKLGLEGHLKKRESLDFFASTTTVLLHRPPGASWGVVLSREGNMCVVARTGAATKDTLRSGDVILRVENEAGAHAQAPASWCLPLPPTSSAAKTTFREMVDLFKNSQRLSVQVQRVADFLNK